MAQIPDSEHKSFTPADMVNTLTRYVEYFSGDVAMDDALEDLHHNITCMYTQHHKLGCEACSYSKVCIEGAF